ncbi:MAG: HEAT repeat domain-containing protein [Oligoflexia bacterium]|nr:HEAT repeat domain-containing protein [Oligoflexia bacterium]
MLILIYKTSYLKNLKLFISTSLFLPLFLLFIIANFKPGHSLASTKEFSKIKKTDRSSSSDSENNINQNKFYLTLSKEQFQLLKEYEKESNNKSLLKKLHNKTLKMGKEAIPILTEVMKENKYPDNSRWMATFLLGKIMGKKSSKFISKFLKHPHWVLRMSALKTLLALKETSYADNYAECLKDDSLLVRIQALENIRYLTINEKASKVWDMLYQKQNYRLINGKLKRTPIIKDVIKTIGELKYEKAKIPLITMLKKNSYDDVFDDIDYSLSKITGKNSPTGSKEIKKIYWQKLALEEEST